jgi:hypothetical protein
LRRNTFTPKFISMQTVRFTRVVEKSGPPEVYLLFTKPEDDADFQKALKANRILTVHTAAGTSNTDYGLPGYSGNAHAQILIFPRSLKAFEGRRVVGIKYDLLHEEPATSKHPSAAKRMKDPKTRPKKKEEKSGKKSSPGKPAPTPKERVEKGKVLKFPALEKDESDDDSEIKAKVRRAVKALEDGRQVAAFNILKSILDA